MDNSGANSTIDRLTTLTVKGPHNTSVVVQPSGGGGTLTSGNMPSSRQMTLYVLRNDGSDSAPDWSLSMTQGAGSISVAAFDASASSVTVDKLTVLTVKGPHNTNVQVQTNDGSGVLTSGTMPSGRQMTLYVLRNDDLDTTLNWRLSMTQGAGNIIVPVIDASTPSATIDKLHTLTVKGPHNTQVQVQTSSAGVLTHGTMPSSRQMTLYVLQGSSWQLYLKQGAGERTVAMDNSGSATTVDMLNTLIIKGPHNTNVQVQTSGGSVLTSGTMASSRQTTLYVLQGNTWQLYLKQGDVVTIDTSMDNSGSNTTMDKLCVLTVHASSGTVVQVMLGGNLATSGTVPSSGTRTLYVVRNATNYDVNGQSVDCSGVTATVTIP